MTIFVKKYGMSKTIIFLLIITNIILISCSEEEVFHDQQYPTTVQKLATAEFNQRLITLSETPLSTCTAIDTFGFLNTYINDKNCEFDTVFSMGNDTTYTINSDTIYSTENDTVAYTIEYDTIYSIVKERVYLKLSYAEITGIFNQALIDYKSLLNIEDPSLISVSSITTLDGKSYEKFTTSYPDSASLKWIVTSNIQNINGLQIVGTEIKMVIFTGQVVSIGGRRYTDVYVPSTEYITKEEAQTSLIGEKLSYSNSELTPGDGTYWYESKKIIVPITRSNGIELRVCWVLYPETWEVIIDTQSGEILSTTDISKIN
jgi:hypothetical protein